MGSIRKKYLVLSIGTSKFEVFGNYLQKEALDCRMQCNYEVGSDVSGSRKSGLK